jgi:hypothetical protein
MKRTTPKLSLTRETLHLLRTDLAQARGASGAGCHSTLGPPPSATICSVCCDTQLC